MLFQLYALNYSRTQVICQFATQSDNESREICLFPVERIFNPALFFASQVVLICQQQKIQFELNSNFRGAPLEEYKKKRGNKCFIYDSPTEHM